MCDTDGHIDISIIMVTYNHEAYIKEAIEGVLSQKCKYNIELIITNDCSLDKTESIIKPNINNSTKIQINYKNHSKNIGMMKNFSWALKNAKGRYLAFCDGDDYWISTSKLQKQVDFLEANPEYAMCFHPVKVYNQTQQVFVADTITRKVESTTTLKDLVLGNYIHTPSVLFRNQLNPLPDWFGKTPIGDYPLWCLLSLKGKIYQLPDEMAVYRVHNAGAMSAIKKQTLTQRIEFNDGMYPFYNYMYEQSGIKIFQKKAISCININRNYALREKQYPLAKQYAKKALNNYFFQLTVAQLLGNILVLISPKLIKKIQ